MYGEKSWRCLAVGKVSHSVYALIFTFSDTYDQATVLFDPVAFAEFTVSILKKC